MFRLLPVSRSTRAANTWTWTPPFASRCWTALQAYRSGSSPAQAVCSNSWSTSPICPSVGWSSGAQAITPVVLWCANSRESATAWTSDGSPIRTSTLSRSRPSESFSPVRYPAVPPPPPPKLTIIGGLLHAGERSDLPPQRHQVRHDLDGFRSPLVGVGPARDLVQVVADPRQLRRPRPLDFGMRHGPGLGSLDGPPHQGRETQARPPRRSLGGGPGSIKGPGARASRGTPALFRRTWWARSLRLRLRRARPGGRRCWKKLSALRLTSWSATPASRNGFWRVQFVGLRFSLAYEVRRSTRWEISDFPRGGG